MYYYTLVLDFVQKTELSSGLHSDNRREIKPTRNNNKNKRTTIRVLYGSSGGMSRVKVNQSKHLYFY